MAKQPRAAQASPPQLDAARVAAWTVALHAVQCGVASFLSRHHIAALIVQMLVADGGAGRLGVAWSDPTAPSPATRVVLLRAARGAALGLGAAVFTVGFALATGAGSLGLRAPPPAMLATGVLAAVFMAARDELVLRGLVLRAFRHTLSPPMRVAACAVVAAAARAGQDADASLGALLASPVGWVSMGIAALGGVCFALLWLRERGAWTATGAHAAWTFASTTGISGCVFDVRFRAGAWGGGALGLEGGLAALVATLMIAAGAIWAWRRGSGAEAAG
jgi:membrane protease YdiL (CAAX protease family)